jgi:hypothetical protein
MHCLTFAKINWSNLLCRKAFFASVLTAFFLSWSQTSFAITRIGNTKFGSEKLSFVAELSGPFVFLNSEQNDGAKLVSQDSSIFRNGEIVEIKTLSELAPDLDGLSRKEFVEVFSNSHAGSWKYLRGSDACVEAFIYTSRTRTVGVAAWGTEQGIVFMGGGEAFISDSIRSMMRSVRVLPGGCKWF